MRSQSPLAQTTITVTTDECALSAKSAREQERPPCFSAKFRPHFFFSLSLRSTKVQRESAERCRRGKVTGGNRKSALMALLFRAAARSEGTGVDVGARAACTKAKRGLKIATLLRLWPGTPLRREPQLASVSAHNATAAVIDALPVFSRQREAFSADDEHAHAWRQSEDDFFHQRPPPPSPPQPSTTTTSPCLSFTFSTREG